MTTSNQTFRQAANSPLGREAREAAKSAADTARSVGDDVSDLASDAARKAGDFATDVSRRAGRQFERWRGTAGDVWDEVGVIIGHENGGEGGHSGRASCPRERRNRRDNARDDLFGHLSQGRGALAPRLRHSRRRELSSQQMDISSPSLGRSER